MVGKSGLYALGFCWKSGMEPRSVILEEFWLESGIVMCLGHHMEVWSGGNLMACHLVHPMDPGCGDV